MNVSSSIAETLVERGGITNHHSMAYLLTNISAKNNQNRWMCVVWLKNDYSRSLWDILSVKIWKNGNLYIFIVLEM